jgi:FkbM family methyltransferase
VVLQAQTHLKQRLRTLARRAGYDVSPFTPKWNTVARRGRLLRALRIDVVLDVGANTGQFADELRRDLGYRGRICSFEPVSDAYSQLTARAGDDPAWTTFNFGLGDEARRVPINVAANSESSSVLEMLPDHAQAAPESRFVRAEEIELKTLDEIFGDVVGYAENVYLKIDTQGFEGHVLRGAERSLRRIDTIQVEMPLAPLYAGEVAFFEMSRLLLERNYVLYGIEPGFSDPQSGRLLQVDGIFHREH